MWIRLAVLLGSPLGRFPAFSRWHVLHWQCLGKNASQKAACWHLPRLPFMSVKPSGAEGVLRGTACLQMLHGQWSLVPPLIPWKGKGILPEVQTICFYGQNL